jgi:anthranilate phosphoribosyltransferase
MNDLAADFARVLDGETSFEETKAFLVRSIERMGDAEALAAGAQALRDRMIRVEAPEDAIDVCGTGGDGAHTLNISTAVAFVVAGAGAPVAKHGNRAMSSKSGTADVLAALGVNLDAGPDLAARAIVQAGVGFLFAQKHHSAMKHVAPVRTELGTRTIFNLIGPLSNPAGAKRQLLGVFARKWVRPLAETLGQLGAEAAWVAHGSDGLDELTTTGASFVAELKNGAVREFEITPEDAGLPRAPASALKGGDAAHNAHALKEVLHGRAGAYRDIVLLNAAAALIVAGKAVDLKAGADQARAALDGGKAAAALEGLIAISNGRTP